MIQLLNFLESSLIQKRVVLLVTSILLGLYLLPLLVVGQGMFYQIFDNLDSNPVWLKILAESKMIFSDSNAIIPNMMGGLPRHAYGSEFNVQLWLFYFFPPFTAYVINEFVIHITAFISMWILLTHHIIKPTRNNNIIIATGALYFALLPFWPWGGLSVAGMPLVVYAFLNIRSKVDTWKDWAILGFMPLYSSLVLVYFFFFIAAGVYWTIDSIRKRDWQWRFLGAMVFMGMVYLGVEYRLVYITFFDSSFISHRNEFGVYFRETFMNSYRLSAAIFLNGQIHTKENHYLFILPIIAIAGVLINANHRFKRWETAVILGIIGLASSVSLWDYLFTTRYALPIILSISLLFIYKHHQKLARTLGWIMGLLIVISYWYGFWFNEMWKPLAVSLPFLESFNFSRLVFFQPILWALITVIALKIIVQKLRYTAIMIYLLWGAIVYVGVNNATYLWTNSTDVAKMWNMDYRKYYSENVFEKIKHHILLPQNEYRIASLGIDPVVSLYNGFYTIDGYSVNYPLEYKQTFQKIIQRELDKGGFNTIFFEKWGSKCYLIHEGVQYDFPNDPKNFETIYVNVDQMYVMGARYLITPFPIIYLQKELIFEKAFHGDGERDIYLYRMQP